MRILLAVDAAAVFGVTGLISQLPGAAGCVSKLDASCAAGRAVGALRQVAVSADGRNVYAVGGVGSLGVLDAFARRSDGSLSQFRVAGRAGLETPAAVALSPSGRLLVTAAENGRAIGLWKRGADGSLSALGRISGFAHPSGLAFSASGKLLLVA